MSIVKLAENIEIERGNNRALRDAVVARIDNLIAHAEAHLSSLQAARENMLSEFKNRDEALRVIIEGESNAT